MFQANQQIGGYTLINPIGRGGFGEVWLAERRTELLTTLVAIKLPHKEQINLEAIRQEAALWAKASGHANVLPIIEANIYDGQIVIVSEFAPDGSMEEKIRDGMPIKQAVEMLIGVLSGLGFLHTRQIIHRDIKPANILLQGDTPRLADFGISRIINTTSTNTAVVGTPIYMAPEVFDSKRSFQSDIWAVGVILYQMLSNNLPFTRPSASELMWAIMTKDPDPLPNSVPPDLQRIVQKALAKLPENRFTSAREMREELQLALLNISHPTFAKTEVLEKKQFDNQTIEDRTIFSEKTKYEVPPTEFQKIQDTPKPILPPVADLPIVRPLFNRVTDDNNQQVIGQTEFNVVPPTVSSLTPDSEMTQLSTIPDPSVTTNKWTTRWIIPWIFYFLTPGIGLLTIGLISSYGSFSASIVLLTVILFNVIGLLLGYIFPEGKWKWGWLLTLIYICLTIYFSTINPFEAWRFTLPLILTVTVTAASYLGAWINGKIHPSLETNLQPATLATKNEWTKARIVRWVFYFLTPIIGKLAGLTGGKIPDALFYLNLRYLNIIDYWKSLVIIFIILTISVSIVFGIMGALLGYIFPQERWRWGMWLNIINLVFFAYSFLIHFGTVDSEYLDKRIAFFLWVAANLCGFIVPCITSYLGSRLALRKAENKLVVMEKVN